MVRHRVVLGSFPKDRISTAKRVASFRWHRTALPESTRRTSARRSPQPPRYFSRIQTRHFAPPVSRASAQARASLSGRISASSIASLAELRFAEKFDCRAPARVGQPTIWSWFRTRRKRLRTRERSSSSLGTSMFLCSGIVRGGGNHFLSAASANGRSSCTSCATRTKSESLRILILSEQSFCPVSCSISHASIGVRTKTGRCHRTTFSCGHWKDTCRAQSR